MFLPLYQLTFLDPVVDLIYPVVGMDLCYFNPLGNVRAHSSHLGTSQPEFVIRSGCSHGQDCKDLGTLARDRLGQYCFQSPS